MKENTDKRHLLMSKNKYSEIHIGQYIIKSSVNGKVLGIKKKTFSGDLIQNQNICQ